MSGDYVCQNCGTHWEEAQLLTPIPDLEMRVEAGEVMPAGECPDCGALCHKVSAYEFVNNDGTERVSVDAVNEDAAATVVLARLGWGCGSAADEG